MLRGPTTRNYSLVTRSFAQAYGIEKSATSERFIQASRDKLKEPMERPLGGLKLCAIVIDGTPFQGRQTLEQLHKELDRINPSAARSLAEGMEETLTVHKLRVPDVRSAYVARRESSTWTRNARTAEMNRPRQRFFWIAPGKRRSRQPTWLACRHPGG